MENIIKTSKKYVIALALLFVFVSLSGPTYSLFLKSEVTNTFNYNTGLLDLQFTEDEQLSLESAFPMLDSDAIKEEPYTLTIKNTGTLTYVFDLKMLSSTDQDVIDSKYIKVKVNEQNPHTLYTTNSVIASNVILYPGEEKTFNINIWLDIDTPNTQLGNKFIAKIVTTGSSVYKTLDSSGANHPILKDNMLPIYYDEGSSTWRKADSSNTIETHGWYDYDNKKWANVATIKESSKQIYDITRNNNITVDNLNINNGNVVIKEEYLDLNIKFNNNIISNIIRIKFDELPNDKIYIISNGNTSYYFDNNTNNFVYTNNGQTVTSEPINIEEDKWYIIGYTYDGSKVKFYVDGNNYGTSSLYGTPRSSNSFKVGTDNTSDEISRITVGDIYIYKRILTDEEINNNYRTSINVIYDNLVCGYNEFIPMTLKEYYQSRQIGSSINNQDIEMNYVWIPRYKYRVWNITGEKNIDSYDAYNKGIDIVFEKGNISSGVIYCEQTECYSDNLKITKVTQRDNGAYYTHPAFTKGDQQLEGIWVSKYELSSTNNDLESKSNNKILTNTSLSNFYQIIKNKDNNYNVIKNTEWGAISYLSHSKYGLCTNNICSQIGTNSTTTSGNELSDSTTNNKYGVFDMGGSATEFVMANYANENKELSLTNSNFTNISLNREEYELYYENSFILGDATKELSLEEGIWYNNTSISVDNTNNWIIRGGILNLEGSGIFYHSATNDISNEYITTRIVIK